MDRRAVLVLAKAPIPGRVKTRLSPPCTPEMCADIAAAALVDTLDACRATGRRVVLALDGPIGPWLPTGVEVVPQTGGAFAERLHHAWQHLPHGGVQIGMDTPQVGAAALERAIAGLAAHPSALGMAEDGGWWVLALRAPHDGLFDGIPMSTSHTGCAQWERLVALGLDPLRLDDEIDIDDWSSACRVAAGAPQLRTAAAVRRIGERLGADV